MSEHKATIRWTRKATPDDFAKGKYSREHTWSFDGGVTVPAISSCHMLTFLYVAQKKGFVVESYEDQAVGVVTKSERGATPWVSAVTLHLKIVYGGEKEPTAADEEHLHHEAHEQCFIAQSVKTQITVKRST
jgi:organic hydroperoxide reductase OsmC/OhrA